MDSEVMIRSALGFWEAVPVSTAKTFAANRMQAADGAMRGLVIPDPPNGQEEALVIAERIAGTPHTLETMAYAVRQRREQDHYETIAYAQCDDAGKYISGVILAEGKLRALKSWRENGSCCRIISADEMLPVDNLPSRFARIAAVLGGGEEALLRSRQLRVMAIGFGRGNSQLLCSLAQTFPLREITVVDDDVWSEHHLNGHRGIGRPGETKVDLARRLLGAYGAQVKTVRARFEDSSVAALLADQDLILLWPDESGLLARRMAALASAAYAVPVLSIGTHAQVGEGAARVSWQCPIPVLAGCA